MLKKMNRMAVALTMLAFFLPLTGFCGTYWEMQVESSGMPMPENLPANLPKEVMDQFNKKTVKMEKYFLDEDGYRVETEENVTLFDFREMAAYSIDPNQKTYMRIDMAAMNMDSGAAEMMKEMQKELKITATGEKKKVAGYNCVKYRMTSGMGDGEYWATKDIGAWKDVKEMGEKMSRMLDKNPMLKQMNVGSVMKTVDGFVVRTVMNVMGAETASTLKMIEERKFDRGIFTVPEGYSLKVMPKFSDKK